MAHTIQKANIPARELVGVNSRYANSRVIYYGEDKKLTFETYKRQKRAITGHELWFQITKEVEYKPHLVSFDQYGTPDLWWSIMEFNGMSDILEFKAGVNIRLPGNIMP